MSLNVPASKVVPAEADKLRSNPLKHCPRWSRSQPASRPDWLCPAVAKHCRSAQEPPLRCWIEAWLLSPPPEVLMEIWVTALDSSAGFCTILSGPEGLAPSWTTKHGRPECTAKVQTQKIDQHDKTMQSGQSGKEQVYGWEFKSIEIQPRSTLISLI